MSEMREGLQKKGLGDAPIAYSTYEASAWLCGYNSCWDEATAALARLATERTAWLDAAHSWRMSQNLTAEQDAGLLALLKALPPTPAPAEGEDDRLHEIADIIHEECFASPDDDSRCERAAARVAALYRGAPAEGEVEAQCPRCLRILDGNVEANKRCVFGDCTPAEGARESDAWLQGEVDRLTLEVRQLKKDRDAAWSALTETTREVDALFFGRRQHTEEG